MEAELYEELPLGRDWRFEPKWDGFRCLAFKSGATIELRAKSGKSLNRYFPDIVEALAAIKADHFVIDGELLIRGAHGFSFDDLQLRLHPAESRVRKLAAEAPAIFVLFDCLYTGRESFVDTPLRLRRAALERFYASIGKTAALRLSPFTTSRRVAGAWLDHAAGALDGVIAKNTDGAYEAGERAMIKVKRRRTADCVVGGFRYERGTKLVGSLLLGLYNDFGKLDHVGFTSSLASEDKKALIKKLKKLIAKPGFDGKAPGGPSRWATDKTSEWEPLRPRLVVEVRYDQITDNRFRHGAKLLRWRPDKAPGQCTFEQLEPPKRMPTAVRDALA